MNLLQINSYLHDSSEKLHSNTDKLASKFESMIRFFKQLSVNHQQSICESYLNIQETAMTKVESIKNRECALIVAGKLWSYSMIWVVVGYRI
jgi:ribosomal 30S subunit maturation factor RimM